MEEEAIVRLLKGKVSELQGKVSAYDKFKSKIEFFTDIEIILNDIRELYHLLEKEVKKGRDKEWR